MKLLLYHIIFIFSALVFRRGRGARKAALNSAGLSASAANPRAKYSRPAPLPARGLFVLAPGPEMAYNFSRSAKIAFLLNSLT